MIQRSRSIYSAVPLSVLLLLCGLTGGLVRGAAAQTEPAHTDPDAAGQTSRQDRSDRSTDEPPHRTAPPANPLVLPETKSLTPKTSNGLPRFKDYRRREKQAKPEDHLPLFGYDFFRPAREIIEAHRAYLRNRYGRQDVSTTNRRRTGTNRSDQTPPLRPLGDKERSSTDPASFPDRRERSSNDPSNPDASNSDPSNSDAANMDAAASSGGKERGDRNGDAANQDATDQTNGDGSSLDGKERGARDVNSPTGDAADGEDATGRRSDRQQDSGDPADRNGRDKSDAADPQTGSNDRESGDLSQGGQGGQGRAADPRDRTADAGTGTETKRTSRSPQPDMPRPDDAPVDAYSEVADPLSQLYRNVNASVPATYRIASGDTLTIRFWSPRHEMQTLTRTVDAQGGLYLPDAGAVVVRALTMDQVEKALRAQLRRYYNGVDVSVTLGKLRTIQVVVSGQAFQPGSYTVPAVATAYNVIYASGGPTETGSLRNIEVRRNGRLVGTLDVYKYLMVGGQAGDIALQSGDLIYIPPRRSRIAVRGEVLQPAYFELREGETLHDALNYAGGIKASGVDQRIQINTVDPGEQRILKDVDLKIKTASSPKLYDGDRVEVFSVRPLISNRVTVEGAVDQPSDYALEPGMHISDLIKQARGLLPDAYLTRADLFRANPDDTTTLITLDLQKALDHAAGADLPLQRWDRLKIYARQEVSWTGRRSVMVRGAVSHPGVYSYSDRMRVSDLLMMAGGPLPNAYMPRSVLLHQHGDGTYDLDYVNLDDARQGDASHDRLLQDNDVLAVYRNGEAEFQPEHLVSVRGAVVAPGPYPRTEGMRLSDLVHLAGGFIPGASERVTIAHARQIAAGKDGSLQTAAVTFDAQHRCAAGDDLKLEDGDVVTVQSSGRYQEKVQVVYVQGAVAHPGPVILSNRNMRMSDALHAAGGLLPEAFPQGAEFVRDPDKLLTSGQRSLTHTIGQLNDLLNQSAYSREKGKSYIERIKAINSADQSSSSPLPIGGAAAPTSSAIADKVAAQLAQQDMISPARLLKGADLLPDGSIAIDLPSAMRRPLGPDDLILVDGDVITVPERPTTVQVIGAVFHARAVLYEPHMKLEDYLARAGGFAPDAARDRIEIIHVGGGLIPASKSSHLQPGDVILVPTRVLAEKLTSNQNAFDGFFRSLTSSALIFKVATSLFGF